MADNTARIEEINEILRAGATEVVVDGTKVKYNFAELRKERRMLMAADDTHRGRRPVVSSINLS